MQASPKEADYLDNTHYLKVTDFARIRTHTKPMVFGWGKIPWEGHIDPENPQ
jgi:hypothetical protein